MRRCMDAIVDTFEAYQIFTPQGQMVVAGNIQKEIDIRSLNTGIYLLKTQSENRQFVKYFIKR